jgi:hypothetical protein
VLEKLLEMARVVGSESWRNERLDGKRFSLPSDGSWDRPEEGILTMDIVDRTIAPDDEKVTASNHDLSARGDPDCWHCHYYLFGQRSGAFEALNCPGSGPLYQCCRR